MSHSDKRSLVSDVRELVELFREIGGETLDVESAFLENLPISDFPRKSASPTRVIEPQSRSIAEATPEPVAPTPNPQPRRDLSSILSRAKLSAVAPTGATGKADVNRPLQPTDTSIRNEKSKPSPMKEKANLSKHNTLEEIRKEIGDCRRCGLCEERTQVVHSIGNPTARLMFIGEAPGADEDAKGEPFVGRAGQLLTRIIDAMGFQREEVFIGNINRCRPPGNRAPKIDEADQCRPFLLREIEIIKPEVIVVLGNTACQNLLNTKEGITKLRGNFQDYFGVKVMPTFHPAYLLRDPSKKKLVWEDMKQVMELLKSEGDPS